MKAVPWGRMAPDVVRRVRLCAESAERHMKTGEYGKAIDSLHEAIRLQPANPALRSLLEQCHAMKNHFNRVELGIAREVPPPVTHRNASDAKGYGRLPAATAVVMVGALIVLSWQHATVTSDETVPPVPTPPKKRIGTFQAGNGSLALSGAITRKAPPTGPLAAGMAGVPDAPVHSRYSTPATRITLGRTQPLPVQFR